ncbi:uncharacterized protein [Procambarus clarkii]|uniref:uncharacterized protein n=1 Tax=Procambarus clarkii TaxID=6728 RepID=UPI0037439E63
MTLKLVLLVATAAVTVAVTQGFPRYIAIPVEDLRLVRRVRSAPQYEPQYEPQYHQPQFRAPVEKGGDSSDGLVADGSESYARQAGYVGGNDHVDYGAYTGGYGAFGWYSDHPVCINCGYGYH